tara:strand:- start:517 stop:753 length:237 start_codon:yes stop_codon:yes gene_type:complete
VAFFLVGDFYGWRFVLLAKASAFFREQGLWLPIIGITKSPSSHMLVFQYAIVPHATQNKKMDDVDKGRRHFLTDCTLI